jgi:O-antigen/teichoic acid export membrane protein
MGTLYMGAGGWTTYALNFLIMIGIARLLGPADLGAYAFVAALNEFLNIVGAGSVGHAVLQSRDESQSLHDTAYSISGILGLIGLAGALALAPVLLFYRGPEAAWFIVILGVVRIATLLAGIPIALLERSFRYGRLAWLSLLTGIIPNLFALGLAWRGLGPWSLIVRDVLVAASMFGLAHLWMQRRLHFRMRRAEAGRIMSFWRPMFVSKSFDIVTSRIDRLAVGAYFGDAALGLFHQARLFSDVGSTALRAVNQLAFNLFSRVQDDRERLARATGLVNYFLVRASFAIAAVFLVFPEPAIEILLGEAWVGAAPMLRGLALYVALIPSLENLQWLLYARLHMRRNIQLRLIQLGVYAPAILLAVQLREVTGIALAVSFSTVVAFAAAIWFTRDVVGRSVGHVFTTPSLALLASAGACAALAAAGALRSVPAPLLLLLPPAAFTGLLLLAERSTLLREIGYLRVQFAQRPVGDEPPGQTL